MLNLYKIIKMKKITSILVGLVIIGFAYVGYNYYKNRQLKETYKTALVKDLEQAYRRISLQELDSTKKMNKNIQHYFEMVLQEYGQKKHSYKDAEHFLIYQRNLNIYLDLETLDDINWKAAQQSGILSKFSKEELTLLNKVYRINDNLKVTKEAVKKIFLEPFAFSTKDGINSISTKYVSQLLKLETRLYDLENATKNALKELNPTNKPLLDANH